MDIEVAKILATSLKFLAVAVCMIPLGSVGRGIGGIFSSLIEEVSRNPGAKGILFTYALIGFALVEASALYALVVAFIILFS